jgi:hypothetical protein
VAEIHDEMARFRKQFADLSGVVEEYARSSDDGVEDLAQLFIAVDNLRKDVNMVHESVMSMIAERMQEEVVFLENGMQLEKKQGEDRKKWDHSGLAVEVARKIQQLSIDPDTGEITMTPDEMMIKMLDFAAPSYWRLTQLRSIGVDADKYCEKSDGKVRLVPSQTKLV